MAGCAEAAARDAVNVVRSSKLGCELVVYVGVVSEAGQQDHRLAGAAPIKHFQFHIGVYSDELDVMIGLIACDTLRKPWARQQAQNSTPQKQLRSDRLPPP